MNIFLDIETVPDFPSKQEYARVKKGIEEGSIIRGSAEFNRLTYGALSPFEGKVVLITYQVNEGNPQFLKEWQADELTILKKFYDVVNQRGERATLIGYNILKFDLPFMFTRMLHHRAKLSMPDSDWNWVFKKLINMSNVVDLMQMHMHLNGFTNDGMVHDVVAGCYDCQPKGEMGSSVREHYYTDPEGIMQYVGKEFVYPQIFAKMFKDGLVARNRFQSIIKDSNERRQKANRI